MGYFGRIEFQDGKRKRGAPNARLAYHGSGRPHVHFLVWLENIASVQLPSVVSASLPAEGPLRRVVEASQLSWGDSGWPRRDEASLWDDASGVLRLHHSAQDKRKSVRAYMPDVLGALKAHMDVQTSDGRGMLLRYVAGYVPKFSDSFSHTWLNDEATDFQMARRVLTEYHPLEPEMLLQLGAQQHHQCFASGSFKRFVVPVPFRDDAPKEVQAYVASTWRSESMTLLQFLRKTNAAGAIHEYLHKRHKASGASASLQAFANAAPTRGEVMVAAIVNSRFSDTYYSQWAVMNIPFRALDDLRRLELDKVPEEYRGMALCLLHRPDFWRNEQTLRSDLELEAYREPYVLSNLAMVTAHASVVDAYLVGELVVGRDPVPRRRAQLGGVHIEPLPDQWHVIDSIQRRVQLAMRLACPDDLEQAGARGGQDEQDDMRALVVLGPAGSGKSTAVKVAMQHAMEAGARVVLACPTRMLVASYREQMPQLDVDSVHALFQLFKPEQSTLDAMTTFDLIVIEEISQLSMYTFERLLRLWDAAGQVPALLFLGDFAQLRGVEPTRATDSPRYGTLKPHLLKTMRRYKCDLLRQKLELLRYHKPNREQLKMLKKGHKAPSRARRPSQYMSEFPTASDVYWVFREHPDTLVATISRPAAAWVNEMALRSLFEGQTPLDVISGDPEASPANFRGTRQVDNAPNPVPIFIGMRVALTRNVNKEMDFVNGMGAWAARVGDRAKF